MHQSLMKRYEGNPVLTIDDLPVKGPLMGQPYP